MLLFIVFAVKGSAIAQAASHWIPIAAARFRTRVRSCGIVRCWYNSVACVHEQTIPIVRSPLVGKVSANICG
jgi:hypothetical protein